MFQIRMYIQIGVTMAITVLKMAVKNPDTLKSMKTTMMFIYQECDDLMTQIKAAYPEEFV
jgi:hypothetical protein